MSSTSNYDTPSPRTSQTDTSQDERSRAESSVIADSLSQPQQQSRPQSPVRRSPSFEKLDKNEVAKALQIAEMLKTAKSGNVQHVQAKPVGAAQAQKSQPAPAPKEPAGPKPPSPPTAEYMPRPPPVPFSGTTNPDAVALRATTDLLQIQKARATENIQRLEQLKLLNRKDPKAFLNQLLAGKLKAGESEKEGVLGPTLSPDIQELLKALEKGSMKDEAKPAEAEAGVDKDKDKSGDTEAKEGAEKEDKPKEEAIQDYPKFPTPQNIVRTPAINWAKYGVLGDTLDKMHEEQRTNPTLGEPEKLASRSSQPATPVIETDQVLERGPPPKAMKFVMAAPYDPLKDQLKKSRKPS